MTRHDAGGRAAPRMARTSIGQSRRRDGPGAGVEPGANAPRAGEAFNRVVEHLIWLVDRFGCSSILAPWRFDPHCDHEAASLIASEVAGRLGVRHIAYPVCLLYT